MCCSATSSIRPRGRIYLIKDMLEHERPATRRRGQAHRPLPVLPRLHDDLPVGRALHAPGRSRPRPYRGDLPAAARRPAAARAARDACCPIRGAFALALLAAHARRGRSRRCCAAVRFEAACRDARAGAAPQAATPLTGRRRVPRQGERRGRVALLAGCANEASAPSITQATIRVLNRHGIEVVLAAGRGLLRLAGRITWAARSSARLRRAPMSTPGRREIEGEELDAILVTISGCGTTVKDYGFMLRTDPAYAEKAAECRRSPATCRSIWRDLPLPAGGAAPGLTVAYHSACSLQHGQQVDREPQRAAGGFGLRRQGGAGGAFVLRLGRHLQHHAAGDRRSIARRARSRISNGPEPT